MSETAQSPEIYRDRIELNTTLVTYFISASMFASSEGFEDDVAMGAYMINKGDTNWYDGKVITEADKRSYAASSILVQMYRNFNNTSSEFNELVLSPVVASQPDLYIKTQQVIDELGLSFSNELIDATLIRTTICAMDNSGEAPNMYAARAAEQWTRRGTLELDMIDLDELGEAIDTEDHSDKAPDAYYEAGNLQISEYPLPETPVRRQTVPYYKKFYDEKQGEEWLSAILEDLLAIKG